MPRAANAARTVAAAVVPSRRSAVADVAFAAALNVVFGAKSNCAALNEVSTCFVVAPFAT